MGSEWKSIQKILAYSKYINCIAQLVLVLLIMFYLESTLALGGHAHPVTKASSGALVPFSY